MNKFLYKYLRVIYFLLANIRMSYYLIKGNNKKSKEIITEHFNW